ncbi:MAG: hypothetical protein AB1424_00160 [Thermodesulfobacteriota bacterium]
MRNQAISFDETDFKYQGERDGVHLWFTPMGDGLGLYSYLIPPDIGADLHDVVGLRAFYRRIADDAGLGVIEIEQVIVGECKVVRTLFKMAQEPAGRTYLGSLTFPFRDCSYVLKVQCPEHGVKGLRDTVVSMNLMQAGKIGFDPDTGAVAGWLDDPYDPNERGPMTRNQSERPEFDAQFPEHPLSRARLVLDHLQRTVQVEETVRKQPKYQWHG